MNRDGSDLRQVTRNGAANFAPYFTPDGARIIFASNLHNPRGRDFDLFLISVDGTGLERVTYNDTFDGFPMFSPDGTKLVFASNRFAKTDRRHQRLHRRLGGPAGALTDRERVSEGAAGGRAARLTRWTAYATRRDRRARGRS